MRFYSLPSPPPLFPRKDRAARLRCLPTKPAAREVEPLRTESSVDCPQIGSSFFGGLLKFSGGKLVWREWGARFIDVELLKLLDGQKIWIGHYVVLSRVTK